MLRLIYGSGLRVSECTRLRVKDLDFEQELVTVRASKGDRDRTTLRPGGLVGPLKAQLERVKALHDRGLAAGHGAVEPPYALQAGAPAEPPARGRLRTCGRSPSTFEPTAAADGAPR